MPITKASGNSVTAGAKGDLVVGSATNDSAILAVGNNGETLVADSSQTTGLRWQSSTAAGKNVLINGAMEFWQRGTSFTNINGIIYTADRWGAYSGTTGRTISRQTTGNSTFQYCARIARDSGNTNTSAIYFYQSLETAASIPLANTTVVLSFWARAGANFSGASSQISADIQSGTGTDQNVISGYTGVATVASSSITLTTSWQRFSVTGTVSSTATELSVRFIHNPVGTAGAADHFEIANAQLEIGSAATAFTRAGGTLAGELAACQRYYVRFPGTTAGDRFGNGWNKTTTVTRIFITFPQEMRIKPTSVETTGTASNYGIAYLNTAQVGSAVPSVSNATKTNAVLEATVASGLTAGDGSELYASDANTYLGFSAEL